jgi:hypothetical protein
MKKANSQPNPQPTRQPFVIIRDQRRVQDSRIILRTI